MVGRAISECVKKNEIDGGDRINLALVQDVDKWQAFVKTVMNSRVP